MDMHFNRTVSYSDNYLNKVYGLLLPELDHIDTRDYELKYDQMEPFFDLLNRLKNLIEDLSEIEIIDLIEDLIVKKNLPKFSDLNFLKTLNDLRLCALNDIVDSKIIKARDFLIKLRYLFSYYKIVVEETDLLIDYLEHSSYFQKKFLNMFPNLKDSFHFLLTCDLEILDKLNLEEVSSYSKLRDKFTKERDDLEEKLSNLQIENSVIYESEDEFSKQTRIKLDDLDKVSVENGQNGDHKSKNSENGQREELIIGEINYEPANEMNCFIRMNFEGKQRELMVFSTKSTINLINESSFKKLSPLCSQQKKCLVDLVVNGLELGIQDAIMLSLEAYFSDTIKVKMNYFYFDGLKKHIKQNLIGNGFIKHIHSLSPHNYFTLKEDPEIKFLFLTKC